MIKSKFTIAPFVIDKIVGSNGSPLVHNAILVWVNFDRHRKAFVLDAQAISSTDSYGDKYVVFESPSHTLILESGIEKKNLKKMRQWLLTIQEQVDNQSGVVFDGLQEFLKKYNSQLITAPKLVNAQ